MKVQKSKLVKEVLADPQATDKLREAMRSSQHDRATHSFTFQSRDGNVRTVRVLSVPKPA
jgi:hypothetical protein